MKITIKNQTIELTDDDLKKHGLQRIEKEEFEVGDKYYYINQNGIILDEHWDNHKYDKIRFETGNAFHTKEEAENHLAWLKARAKIVRRIKELNEGWETDWENLREGKYYIYYIHEESKLIASINTTCQEIPQEMYLKSGNLAEQLIKELEPELKIYLGVK